MGPARTPRSRAFCRSCRCAARGSPRSRGSRRCPTPPRGGRPSRKGPSRGDRTRTGRPRTGASPARSSPSSPGAPRRGPRPCHRPLRSNCPRSPTSRCTCPTSPAPGKCTPRAPHLWTPDTAADRFRLPAPAIQRSPGARGSPGRRGRSETSCSVTGAGSRNCRDIAASPRPRPSAGPPIASALDCTNTNCEILGPDRYKWQIRRSGPRRRRHIFRERERRPTSGNCL